MTILDDLIVEYIKSEASLVFLVIDTEGHILNSNRYSRELIGEELQGQMLNDIIVDFTGSVTLACLVGESDKPHLLNVRTAGGLPQTFYFRFFPMGSEILVIGEVHSLELETLRKCLIDINNDLSNLGRELQKKIAEQNRANEQIKSLLSEKQEAYDKLKDEIEERKKAEDALRQSQKMEAIGTLAGGIAHDFNNILAAILGFTEMAIDNAADGRLVDNSLQNVHKSALRARDLVKQILTFSRKATYKKSPLPLSPLIKDTLQLLRASIPANIEIKLAITATSDTILAAPTEVQQILMNLATNASLAMEEEGGTLEIILSDIDFMPHLSESVTDLMPGEYVQLIVKDTGAGMGPDLMRRVFEPFFTTREPSTGTGMGLAVVYGIVTDLKGTITVESEPGIGSTFRVFLPKIKAKAKKTRAQSTHIATGTENILFIDDENMLVEWAKAALERLGYRAFALTDPAEALKIFASDPSRFDLVITDQTMPAMSGMQLSGELIAIRPDIPIILCTGHSATVSPEKAKKAGIKEFLMKPVVSQELAKAVRKVLDKTRKE